MRTEVLEVPNDILAGKGNPLACPLYWICGSGTRMSWGGWSATGAPFGPSVSVCLEYTPCHPHPPAFYQHVNIFAGRVGGHSGKKKKKSCLTVSYSIQRESLSRVHDFRLFSYRFTEETNGRSHLNLMHVWETVQPLKAYGSLTKGMNTEPCSFFLF